VPELHIGEPPETRIEEPAGCVDALRAGASATAGIAARWPDCLSAWAALGQRALDSDRPLEAYAYFRVGYHRGLDRLRKAGWRGSGRVPWSHEANRGFLSALSGLAQAAAALGELDEARRCREFLAEVAPEAPLSSH
jgi:hypothetical protein